METETTYTPPLSREDAETISHAAEVRILEAAQPYPIPVYDPAAYGEARMWLRKLLMGESVTIKDSALAESRAIMRDFFSIPSPRR